MARFIILLLAAIFAHQIEAHEDAPLAVCQAYYAVNGSKFGIIVNGKHSNGRNCHCAK